MTMLEFRTACWCASLVSLLTRLLFGLTAWALGQWTLLVFRVLYKKSPMAEFQDPAGEINLLLFWSLTWEKKYISWKIPDRERWWWWSLVRNLLRSLCLLFGNFCGKLLVSIALSTLDTLWGPAMLQVFPVSVSFRILKKACFNLLLRKQYGIELNKTMSMKPSILYNAWQNSEQYPAHND